MDGYGISYDAQSEGIRSVSISLAEYRELLRKATLYEEEHRAEKRPVSLDNLKEVE